MTALQADFEIRKRTHCPGDRLGNAKQLDRQFGDDAQGSLSPDEEPGDIVTRGGLASARSGLPDRTVRHHHGQGEDGVFHRAVADGVGAGGARGGHPSEGRIRAGVDRKEQSQLSQVHVQLLACDSGLYDAVHIFLMDRQHMFIRPMSIDNPPNGALTPPSNEEPTPNGMTGRP